VTLDRIVKLHRHLREAPQIRVLNVKRSADKGLRMQLFLRDRTPLLDILKAMPEVKKVSALRSRAANEATSQRAAGEGAFSRVAVTTRE
jgi:hypothetical protein